MFKRKCLRFGRFLSAPFCKFRQSHSPLCVISDGSGVLEVGSDRTAYEKAMLLFLSTSLLCPYCLGNVTVPFLLLSTPTRKSNICCGSLVVVDVADAAASIFPSIPPMVFWAALSFSEITGSFDSFTNCLYNPLPYISIR